MFKFNKEKILSKESRTSISLGVLFALVIMSCARKQNFEGAENPISYNLEQIFITLKTEGGFTFDDNDVKFVKDTMGYIVSIPGYESRYDSSNFKISDLSKYIALNKKVLLDPKTHLGGWVYNGNIFLDISRVFPDSTEAVEFAKNGNQKAIYNMSTGLDIIIK